MPVCFFEVMRFRTVTRETRADHRRGPIVSELELPFPVADGVVAGIQGANQRAAVRKSPNNRADSRGTRRDDRSKSNPAFSVSMQSAEQLRSACLCRARFIVPGTITASFERLDDIALGRGGAAAVIPGSGEWRASDSSDRRCRY